MSRRRGPLARFAWTVVAATVVAQTLTAASSASALPTDPPSIYVSSLTDRSNPRSLHGTTVTGWAAIFVSTLPDAAAYASVDFHLDDPGRTQPPTSTDTTYPFDFNGTYTCGAVDPCALANARLYNTSLLRQGTHRRTVVARLVGNAAAVPVATATFVVQHPAGEPVRIYPDAVTPGVATSTADATAFLHTGEFPAQSGVAPGTIDAARAALVRGRVTNPDGTPFANAVVTVPGHPELGSTKSRADGWYDLAVNAGDPLTVRVAAAGRPIVDRVVDPEPQAWVVADEAMVVPFDANAVAVTLATIPAGGFATARGSTVTDSDGTRTSTLLVPSGTTAQMRMPNGTLQPLGTMTVRQTEFTVGANGAARMPAPLPATSAYTYAVDLSADEARAAGATGVEFSGPVWHYHENFLDFPAGTTVPVGYYDEAKRAWVAAPSGVVLDLVSETGGRADVDVTGDGVADGAAALAALGITDDERTKLGELYAPGDSLWRVGITHFSVWDHNWGFWLAVDAIAPWIRGLKGLLQGLLPNCTAVGSVIGCEAQSLGERIDLPGIGPDLVYDSRRVPGNRSDSTLSLLVTPDAALPPSLKRVEVRVLVAGRAITQTLPAVPNARFTFEWDGVDVYGRRLNGAQVGTVRVRYVYEGGYTPTSTFGALGTGEPLTGDAARREAFVDRTVTTTLMPSVVADARGNGLGGWLLANHHSYDPRSRVLALGDGRTVNVDPLGNAISTLAGNGSQSFGGDGGAATAAALNYPGGAAYDAAGNLYVSDSFNDRVRKVTPSGTITTGAGTGTFGYSGDGGAATAAKLASPLELAVAPDGSVYLADVDNHRIRRIAADGTISTVAGTGARGYGGDGGLATSAQLAEPAGVAVAPDGALVVADFANDRVRRIGTDGAIATIAGTRTAGFGGDGGPATAAALRGPSSVAVASDGTIYFADSGNRRVRRILPDGTISTVAGPGVPGTVGDGGPGTAAYLARPVGVALDARGTVYVSDRDAHRVRALGPDGIITTIAGTGVAGSDGDGGLGVRARLSRPRGVTVAPDGGVVVVDAGNQRVRRVGTTPAAGSASTLLVPSPDSDGTVFEFDTQGRHLRTLDELTGLAVTTFGYDTSARLNDVADRDGNHLTITRPTASSVVLTSPDGLATTLALNAAGWVTSVTAPGSLTNTIGYHDGNGLLATFSDRNGAVPSAYTYDAVGRLASARGRDLKTTTLARTELDDGIKVVVETPGAKQVEHRLTRLDDGVVRREVIDPMGVVQKDERRPDGSSVVTVGASVLTTTLGPDPVWGLLRPIPATTTIQAPGKAPVVSTTTRTVTLASASPLDVATSVQKTTVGARAWTTTYRRSDRTVTSVSPEARTTVVTLDAKGHVVAEQVGDLAPVAYGYDLRGRLTSVTRGTGAASRQTSVTYKPNGFVDTTTNALTQTTSYTYDAAGRVTQSTGPRGAVGTTYDGNGNPLTITPPGRPAYATAPEIDDHLDAYTLPDAGPANDTFDYAHDDDRRITGVTLPSGKSVAFGFDSVGRLADIHHGSAVTTYTFTAGRLASATSPDGVTVTPGYTSGLATSATWSGAVSGSVSTTLDDELRVATETVGGTPPVSSGRDLDGLLTSVGAETITRNAETGFVSGTEIGQSGTSWTYSTFGEPDTFTATHAGTPVYEVGYTTRDKAGRIVQRVETTGGATHTTVYGYDAGNRLETVTVDGTEAARYGYDAAGNLTSETTASGTATSTYDAQDRIVTRGSRTYAFDADGQRTSSTDGSAVTTYAWSVGRLAGVTLPSGPSIGYKYDAFGRRVARSVNGSVVRGYLWSGSRPVAETDASGAVLSRFVYGSRAHVPDYVVQGATTYRLVTDERGSVRLVVNTATGAVAQRIDYDPWGRVTADTNPGFQPFGYAGGLTDPDTGLVRFGNRDYDPAATQWLSRDTIGFTGGTNHYAYADGDPVNRIDPTGHSAIGCFADVLGLLGMVPVIGTVFDIASALTYLAAGDWGTAALALSGIILPLSASQLKGIARYGDQAVESAAKDSVQLFRNVDASEFDGIAKSEKFSTGPGMMEGKWFATKGEHAEQWGAKLNGGQGVVVETTIPATVADQLYFTGEKLDGIGPGWYADGAALDMINHSMDGIRIWP